MIYFDNAATTYPKPMAVTNAVRTALQKYGANPGRSGHKMSMAAAEEEYRCRVAAANLFHAEGPENVAFTLNCTHAINIVLKGLLKPGDHVVVSCLEHNAVMRPLEALRQQGVSYTQAQVVPGDSDATLDGFRKALNAKTKLIVCMHASNAGLIIYVLLATRACMAQWGPAFLLRPMGISFLPSLREAQEQAPFP